VTTQKGSGTLHGSAKRFPVLVTLTLNLILVIHYAASEREPTSRVLLEREGTALK
jgi:hypothetical protein